MDGVWFRQASEADVPVILDFIKLLADYEKLSGEVVATEELLREWLFDRHAAEVIFAMEGNTEVGFALFFGNFSTFLGRGGIYLEDLFVKEQYRGRRLRPGAARKTRFHRPRARLRQARMGLPRLEQAKHRLLSQPQRPPHVRLDHLPRRRRDPQTARGGQKS